MPLSSSCKFIFPALALVASFLSLPAPDARADAPEKRTISLSATGAVKTTPDKVDISTGVTTEGQTAREALTKNTDAMTKVVDGLKSAGIEPKDIQTTNFSVSPVYEQRKQGQAAFITGYRVTNQVHIIVRDPKKLGDILDKVVSLGANEIGSISFGVSEPEALEDEARKQALRNAIADAKLYAETAGVELGPVLTITEEDGGYVPRMERTAAPMAMAKDVPIEAGTTTVQVRVRVTWELR
ncbi:MAG TPA: SIMPL domain-containing protein [Methyloceanibacter sp.]|nr:SIMPL domain-containing protein [Methyloceanibacter sp.]